MKQLWFILCLALGGGCFFAERVPLLFAAPVLILAAFCFLLWGKKANSLYPLAALIVFVFASACLQSTQGPPVRVTVRGVVMASKENYYDLRIGPLKRVRVFSEAHPAMGTRVAVRGITMKPEAPRNPGGFDGRHYALSHGIKATLRPTKEEILPEEGRAMEKLYTCRGRFRKKGTAICERYFPLKEAKLLSAMLFGNDADWEGLEDFRTLNVIHILSISGLHIGLIMALLSTALKKLTVPYDLRKLSVHGLLLLYLFLTGFPIGGMRVWLSLLFTDAGKRLWRPVDPAYALGFSGAVFLLVNPFYIYRLGFLFSFFSVYGILAIYPKLPFFGTARGRIVQALGVSVAVSLAIAPLLLFTSGSISIMGLLANVVLLPLAAAILYGGIAVSCLSFLLPPVAAGAAVMTRWIFLPFLFLTKHMALAPFNWVLPSFSVAEACVYYLILHFAMYFPMRRLKLRAGRLLMLQAAAVGILVLAWGHWTAPDLSVTQLYVGQGDCAYVEAKDFRGLIDTGGSRFGADPTARYVVPFLRKCGVGALDAIFLSHYDADHAGGVTTLAKAHKIKHIFAPAPGSEEDVAMYDAIQQEAGVIEAIEGTFPMKDWQLKVFPSYGDADNALSMVMELSSKGQRMLFLGDLPAAQEKMLLADLRHREGIVKLGHHGSKTSSCDEFLEATRPHLALISAGENNSYGHPHQVVLRRLKDHHISYLETKNGAITMNLKDGKVYVSVYKPRALSMGQSIFFAACVVILMGMVYAGAGYFKKRDDLWNQWITTEPIFSTDRKSSVWKRSADK